jgi:TolB-like protein/Tfp pilus assembly protein PilF
VLIGLSQREVAAGRCDQAAASLERALALDPLAEPVHRRLIRVRLDQGAYNAAIRHYRTCAEILKCELGTVPEPATTALYNEALSGLDNPRDPIAQASSVAVPGRASHASQSGTLDILLDRPAVAVIPFDNPGGDADERYFADGITDDIITTLSCWRVFPVIARNSTFGHRDGGDNAAQSAHKLGARYVLHGSVRRADRKIRISVQLIDANSGTQLWTQRYDRELGDIFAVQDEIAGCIVQSIEPQLNRAEQRRAMRKRPENLDGWDYTLRALARLHDFDRAATAEARDLLGRAIALDPLSSYAHSLLALSHFHDALGDWTRDPPERLAATLHAARRAVELDDDDWLSHALLGIALLWTSRQHDLAREEVERALALNPSAAVAHQFLGCILIFAGAPAEAITPLEAVLRLDPRYQTPALILADLSLSHLLLGDPDAAVGLSQRAIQRGQCNVRAYQRLTAALGHRGPKAEARAALDTLLRLQPRFCEAYVAATYPFRLSEHRAVFIEGLQRAGWRSGPA